MTQRNIYFLLVFFLFPILKSFSQTSVSAAWMGGDEHPGQFSVYGIKGMASASNQPGGRYGAMKWTDASGNFWLMGGAGFAGNADGFLNDLWKFNPSTGLWTWISGDNLPDQPGIYGTKGVASTANKPGARTWAVTWTDNSGNLWLSGGSGFAANGLGLLNDLWKFNPSTNEWTWISGDNRPDQNGAIYGTKGIASAANKPGARERAISWTDASGKLWLMGGAGYSSNNYGRLNDLWSFNTSTNEWTWVSGDNTANQVGIYGTRGISSASNKPGGRDGAISWMDNSGNLWLMGGNGFATDGQSVLNDLWKFNPSTNEWTWLSGDNVKNQYGIYGVKGVPDAGNKPGARQLATSWTDHSGNLWLMGGNGYAGSANGELNDLWKFEPTTGFWTWMFGDEWPGQNGVYGIKGQLSGDNKPGGRRSLVSWRDNSGNLWLMGGSGRGSTSHGALNDLWKLCIHKTFYRDADGDGYGNAASSIQDCSAPSGYVANNSDCDDGNAELNPLTKWFKDADADGYYTGTVVISCTYPGAGYRYNGLHGNGDCNDENSAVHPGAAEVCNGMDDDCDGQVDEELMKNWYVDADGDRFGSSQSAPVASCTPVAGSVNNNLDCNDQEATIHPNAQELCDGKDNNCNGQTDEGIITVAYYYDQDGDGFGDPNNSILSCSIPEGYVVNNTDCAPQDATRWRTATLYIDSDSDGYDAGTASVCYGSTIPSGYRETTRGRDCNDANAFVNAGAVEVCGDEIDNDCDGQVDEGCNTTTPLITVDDKIVYESEGKALIAVRLSHIHNQDVKAHFKTIDGTAVSNGRNQDYKNRSGVVVIPAGSLVAYVDITIVMDKITEGSEYFTLQLDHPHYATILDGTSRVTIMDGVPLAMTRANSDVETTKESATSKLAVSISPNPSAGHFILVNKSSNVQSLSVRISDAVGRVIEVKRGVPANASITFGHQYGPGIYYAEIMQGSEKVVVQLVRK